MEPALAVSRSSLYKEGTHSICEIELPDQLSELYPTPIELWLRCKTRVAPVRVREKSPPPNYRNQPARQQKYFSMGSR